MAYNDRGEIIARRNYPVGIAGSTEDLIIASPSSCAIYVAEKVAKPRVRIAEFCCGIGITMLECAKRGAFVTGIDANEDCIQASQANLLAANIETDMFSLIKANITDSSTYDSVLADIAIYDIPYWYDRLDQNPSYTFVVDQVLDKICSKLVVFSPPGYEPSGGGDFVREAVIANNKPDRDLLFYGFDGLADRVVNL